MLLGVATSAQLVLTTKSELLVTMTLVLGKWRPDACGAPIQQRHSLRGWQLMNESTTKSFEDMSSPIFAQGSQER